MPRGRRRRGLMTFLPARTRGAPGWTCAQRAVCWPRCCAVEPVSASGAMAVFLSRCIALAEQNALACWLPVGGDVARPGVTAARLPRCGLRCGIVRRPGPLRPAPGAMGLGLPFPDARSSGRGTYTLARRRANEEEDLARFAWRTGRGGACSARGDFGTAAPPRGR